MRTLAVLALSSLLILTFALLQNTGAAQAQQQLTACAAIHPTRPADCRPNCVYRDVLVTPTGSRTGRFCVDPPSPALDGIGYCRDGVCIPPEIPSDGNSCSVRAQITAGCARNFREYQQNGTVQNPLGRAGAGAARPSVNAPPGR